MQTKSATVLALVVAVAFALFKQGCTDNKPFDLERLAKTLPPQTIVEKVIVHDTVVQYRTVVKYKVPEFADQVGTTDTILLTDTLWKELPFAYNEFTDTITESWGNAILTVLSPQEISAYSLEVNPRECPEEAGPSQNTTTFVTSPLSITVPKNFSLGAGVYYNFPQDRINWGVVAGYKGFGVQAIIDKQSPIIGASYSIRW